MSDGYSVYVVVGEGYSIDEIAIQTAAWHALSVSQAAAPCALTISISTAEYVHELNLQYAGIDSTTDVLAFSPEEEPYQTEPGEPPYIGDVIIAYTVAEKQAVEHKTPLLIELQTLAVHGTLHLLGYDHDTPENKALMWALQSAAMDAVRSSGDE